MQYLSFYVLLNLLQYDNLNIDNIALFIMAGCNSSVCIYHVLLMDS